MRVVGLIARHTLSAAAVLILLSLATFALIQFTPGTTATSIALRQAGAGATTGQIDHIGRELNDDESGPRQYVRWLSNAVGGDLGVSERSGRPISTELGERLPVTLFLGLGSTVIALLAGFGAGVVSAAFRRGPLPGALRVLGMLGASIPTFWMSFLFIQMFAEQLRLLPTSGQSGPASWFMPWVVLAIPAAAVISRVVSVALTEAMSQPYVMAARARGASTRSAVLRDALPNAVGATLNVTGVQLGVLFTGTVIVETVFAWPGLGAWFVDSVKFRDDAAILAGVLVFAFGFILILRTVDAIHTATDPRL